MTKDEPDSAVLTAILEAAVDAIVVSDAKGHIQRVNAAACELFGYTSEELVGARVNTLMPAAIAAHHDGYMRHHIETGENRIIGTGRDMEGQRKDGTVFPLHLSVGETKVDGAPVFVGLMHDLTRRKLTEEALARSQRLDAIGQMTGGIAHDFNNLLTVVIGNLELLEMRGPAAAQKDLIADALSSAELGADLTARLMIFARKSKLSPIKADLRELCEDTLSILHRTLGAPYRLETDFADTVHQVMVDPVQLQSALMNLVLNARDAMGKTGKVVIAVSNVTIDDAYMAQETDMELGEYVRLSVSDNGAGMSPEAQRRAFEPFYTTKAEGTGTGLGLATVYGFVRQSGGHVTLYSEAGHGTSFGLYFPAQPNGQPLAEAALAAAQASGLTRGPVPRGRGETVLVVEDNPSVRKLSIDRIRDLGYATLETDNGDTAYRMLCDGATADVVFSDLVMPGDLNGYDLAAKVAAEFPAVKVLLTSGYASDVVTGSLPNLMHHDVLHKPYRQSELAQRLHALLGGSTSEG